MALAAATSVAAVLNAALLYRGLRKAGVISHGPGWGLLLLRVLVANAAMIFVLLALHRSVDWWTAAPLMGRVGWLSVSVSAGAGIYFLSLLLLGLRPAQFRVRHD